MEGESFTSPSPTITNESVRLVSLLLALILPPVPSSCTAPTLTASPSIPPAPGMHNQAALMAESTVRVS